MQTNRTIRSVIICLSVITFHNFTFWSNKCSFDKHTKFIEKMLEWTLKINMYYILYISLSLLVKLCLLPRKRFNAGLIKTWTPQSLETVFKSVNQTGTSSRFCVQCASAALWTVRGAIWGWDYSTAGNKDTQKQASLYYTIRALVFQTNDTMLESTVKHQSREMTSFCRSKPFLVQQLSQPCQITRLINTPPPECFWVNRWRFQHSVSNRPSLIKQPLNP